MKINSLAKGEAMRRIFDSKVAALLAEGTPQAARSQAADALKNFIEARIDTLEGREWADIPTDIKEWKATSRAFIGIHTSADKEEAAVRHIGKFFDSAMDIAAVEASASGALPGYAAEIYETVSRINERLGLLLTHARLFDAIDQNRPDAVRRILRHCPLSLRAELYAHTNPEAWRLQERAQGNPVIEEILEAYKPVERLPVHASGGDPWHAHA